MKYINPKVCTGNCGKVQHHGEHILLQILATFKTKDSISLSCFNRGLSDNNKKRHDNTKLILF